MMQVKTVVNDDDYLFLLTPVSLLKTKILELGKERLKTALLFVTLNYLKVLLKYTVVCLTVVRALKP